MPSTAPQPAAKGASERKAADAATATLSPAMRQYQQFKAQHPGYVLFYRMGDFYEMFWEDAILAAKTLGVALTSRNKGSPDEIPMAGVPFHAVESYLRKMIAAGHRVAICEQTEDASLAKGAGQARSGPADDAGHAHRRPAARREGGQLPGGGRL